mmetsp:Transcript_32655/g.52270  ORF Transcript_32655/g.52270 Transcript_32655/m.52270 type:complete len:200 (+) Transcript_32655:42-641(+)
MLSGLNKKNKICCNHNLKYHESFCKQSLLLLFNFCNQFIFLVLCHCNLLIQHIDLLQQRLIDQRQLHVSHSYRWRLISHHLSIHLLFLLLVLQHITRIIAVFAIHIGTLFLIVHLCSRRCNIGVFVQSKRLSVMQRCQMLCTRNLLKFIDVMLLDFLLQLLQQNGVKIQDFVRFVLHRLLEQRQPRRIRLDPAIESVVQ